MKILIFSKKLSMRLMGALVAMIVTVGLCNGMAEQKPAALTFDAIELAASQMPTMREYHKRGALSDLHGGFKNPGNYGHTKLIDLESFQEVIDQFFTTMQESLMIPQKWRGGNERLEALLDPKDLTFVPYAQKLVLKDGDTFMCKGDLHGDVHSLIAFMRFLQEAGYTRKENPFRIINPRFHLIFLGDYVDRGLWGAEVIYLLLRLKIENPEQVILIRGNHEDPSIAQVYGFYNEFMQKFKFESRESVQNVYNKISKCYEYLPLVLYVGSPSLEGVDFIQCCHGGMEMGYNPKKFLKSAPCIQFETLRELKRASACAEWNLVCQNEAAEIVPLKDCCCDFVPVSPTIPYPLGFMWHDFVVDVQGISCYKFGRGFACDKNLTHATLAAASSKKVKLRAVVRAHQHSPSDPLMKLLLANKGCALLWYQNEASGNKEGISNDQEDILGTKKECVLRFTQDLVITLLLSPDSLAGIPNFAGNRSDGFTFDTSLLVTTGIGLDTWKLHVINNQVYELRKKALLPEAESTPAPE